VTVDGRGARVRERDPDRYGGDARSERPGSSKVFKLPSRNVGIRKAIVDAQGRYWYMGSHNGRLGVIE